MALAIIKASTIYSVVSLKILTFYLTQDTAMAAYVINPDNLPLSIPFTVFKWEHFSFIFGENITNDNLSRILKNTEVIQSNMREHSSSSSPFPILQTSMFLKKSQNSSKLLLTKSKSYYIFYGEPNQFLLLISKIVNPFHHSWYIVEFENVTKWLDIFENVNLTLESELFVGFVRLNSAQVYEIYRICSTCSVQKILLCSVNEIGVISGDKCLSDKLHRRKNLQRFKINVVVVDVLPFMVNFSFDKIKESAQVSGGLFGAFFSIIVSELNLTYALNILHGYRYGAYINGSWNGMIGHLIRSEADITASELSLAEDRLGYIDYTVSFQTVGRKLYIKKVIQSKNINWKFYSSPFSPFLHLSVCFWLVAMMVTLWFAGLHRKDKASETLSLKESLWVAFSTICQKGAHLIPAGPSAKMIFIIFSFTFLIVFCAYSATLISQLSSAPPISVPFRDLNEFVSKSRDWKAGPIRGDLTQIYMEKTCPELLKKGENSQCDLLVRLWKNVIQADKDNLPLTFKDGFDRVRLGKFAFITTGLGARDLILNQLNEEDACSILEMNGDYLSSNLAFGLRKSFPYKSLINYKILQLQKSGILKRLQRNWLPQQKQCYDSQSSKFKDATIYDVGVAPLIWFMGLLLSLFMLCLEYIVQRRGDRF